MVQWQNATFPRLRHGFDFRYPLKNPARGFFYFSFYMLSFLEMPDKNRNFPVGRDDTLKMLGAIFMVVDHIGLILYPNIVFLRILGRLAFPIFAYYLVQGFIHTSSFKKYALRLFIFGVAAQIPFFIATHIKILNIFFTLFVGLMALLAYERKKYLAVLAIILISGLIPMDYSFYGILTILVFYVFQEKKLATLAQAMVNILGVFALGPIQAYALVGSVLALYYPKNLPKIQINKYFFYFFYPVHLAIIYGLSFLPIFAK